ncbi:MAG: DUF7544 domain-containing protein [Anaerolineae bacterium]
MEYGRIINRAVSITWRHKVLWIFGIAVALFSGGNSGSGIQQLFQSSSWQESAPNMPFGQVPDWSVIAPIVLGILGLTLALGFVWSVTGIIVRYTGEGGLIAMVDEVETTETTTFRSGVNRGWRRLLRLFAIDLLLGIGAAIVVGVLVVIGVLVGLLTAALVAGLSQAGEGATAVSVILVVVVGMVGLALFILLMIAVSAAITLLREYAFRASLLEQLGVFDSIGAAWRLARAHLKESLLMWLLLGLIGLAISIVTLPIFLLGVGAVAVPAMGAYALTESAGWAALVAFPLLIAVVLVAIAISGVVKSFTSSVWTLTYRELRGPLPTIAS